jgi:hypothetical protein
MSISKIYLKCYVDLSLFERVSPYPLVPQVTVRLPKLQNPTIERCVGIFVSRHTFRTLFDDQAAYFPTPDLKLLKKVAVISSSVYFLLAV